MFHQELLAKMSFTCSKIGEKCRSHAFSAFSVLSQSHACVQQHPTAQFHTIALYNLAFLFLQHHAPSNNMDTKRCVLKHFYTCTPIRHILLCYLTDCLSCCPATLPSIHPSYLLICLSCQRQVQGDTSTVLIAINLKFQYMSNI